MTTQAAIDRTLEYLGSEPGKIAWARGSLRGAPGPVLLSQAVYSATGFDRNEDLSVVMEGVQARLDAGISRGSPRGGTSCIAEVVGPSSGMYAEAAMARLL